MERDPKRTYPQRDLQGLSSTADGPQPWTCIAPCGYLNDMHYMPRSAPTQDPEYNATLQARQHLLPGMVWSHPPKLSQKVTLSGKLQRWRSYSGHTVAKNINRRFLREKKKGKRLSVDRRHPSPKGIGPSPKGSVPLQLDAFFHCFT